MRLTCATYYKKIELSFFILKIIIKKWGVVVSFYIVIISFFLTLSPIDTF